MKTFIYHDTSDCDGLRRIEMRTPTVQVLGERPREEFKRVALSPNLRVAEWQAPTDALHEKVSMYSMVFEAVRFSTMKWIQERVEGGDSLGYYARVDSYSYVPQGCRIEGAMTYERGNDIYGYLNTIPLHGSSEARLIQKMDEMEIKLRQLSTRPILSEEQLKQMRIDWLDSRSHSESIPQKLKEYDYFENDNDFRME